MQNIEQTEDETEVGHNKTSLVKGIGAFALGSILFAASGNDEQPFKSGLGHALAGFSKEIPYGRVLIAVGKKGLPGHISIVPVSRLARESNKTEPEVEASLKRDGYLLMAPEIFGELVGKLEQAVLDGSLSLPINVDRLTR